MLYPDVDSNSRCPHYRSVQCNGVLEDDDPHIVMVGSFQFYHVSCLAQRVIALATSMIKKAMANGVSLSSFTTGTISAFRNACAIHICSKLYVRMLGDHRMADDEEYPFITRIGKNMSYIVPCNIITATFFKTLMGISDPKQPVDLRQVARHTGFVRATYINNERSLYFHLSTSLYKEHVEECFTKSKLFAYREPEEFFWDL